MQDKNLTIGDRFPGLVIIFIASFITVLAIWLLIFPLDVKMKKETITFGDRIAAASVMLLASFITAILVWFFVSLFVGKAGGLFIISFNFVIYTTVAFTIISFISPNKSITYIAWVWKKIEKFIKALTNDNGAW